MRLLVCGCRRLDPARVRDWLRAWAAARGPDRPPIRVLIHGKGRGADCGAAQWAASEPDIDVEDFQADWTGLGPAAGPARNAEMIAVGRPDAVLAIRRASGLIGAGTADLIVRARKAGVPVSRVAVVPPDPARILRERRITRAMLQAQPEVLWVFGDNLARRGLGGQAAEMRGEPNAVGIPTKRRPARDAEAYFTDDDALRFIQAAAEPFRRLREHVEAGGRVVWPEAGIGTERAALPERAPRIWAALERGRLRLEALAAADLPRAA